LHWEREDDDLPESPDSKQVRVKRNKASLLEQGELRWHDKNYDDDNHHDDQNAKKKRKKLPPHKDFISTFFLLDGNTVKNVTEFCLQMGG
jgi:hypothetical protein